MNENNEWVSLSDLVRSVAKTMKADELVSVKPFTKWEIRRAIMKRWLKKFHNRFFGGKHIIVEPDMTKPGYVGWKITFPKNSIQRQK